MKAASTSPGAPETPKKAKSKKATGSAKKRKIADAEDEVELEADDGEAAVKAEEDD